VVPVDRQWGATLPNPEDNEEWPIARLEILQPPQRVQSESGKICLMEKRFWLSTKKEAALARKR
jgi:hypothetical protein